MKQLALLMLMLVPMDAFAQTSVAPAVFYDYDAAGNRVLRRVLYSNDRRGDTTVVEPPAPILTENSIVAWPNPTTGLLNVAVSASLLENGPGTYLVSDLQGRTILSGTVTSTTMALDLSGQARGNYLLTVMAGGRKEQWQIVRVP